MKYIKLLLLLLVMAEVQTTFGQGWVVSGSYTYDMTVTAVLNVNCTELSNPSNQVAAFVNGEVRGTALASTVVKGRYVALLTIRSNVTSAESVSFKIYNAATGDVIDAATKVLFQDDAVYGTPSDPYDIRSNYAPTNLVLTNNVVSESNAAQLISTLSVSDADAADTHAYSLASGTGAADNSFFTITGKQLFSSGALNYDLQSKYKIRIKAEDNRGCSISDTFTIIVTDHNFPSTDILLSANTIDENKAAGSLIGSLTSVDQDKNDVFLYMLVSGAGADDNSKFSINGNALVTKSVFDYESKPTYTIRVQTKDSGNNVFEKIISVGVNNVNDKPNVNDISMGVDEYALNGKVLGVMAGTDADAGQTLTYSFINTPVQTTFGINSATGEISLLSNTLNYQTAKSYTLKVVALDNGSPVLSDTATLTIQVVYQNFPPTDITINNTTVKENSLAGTKVGEFATYDKNVEDVFTYSFVNGLDADDNGRFAISGNSLFTSAVFDYETKTSYKIRVQTKDAGNNIFEKSFTISIDNVNDKPNLNDGTMGIAEYSASGTAVGTITGIDADVSQTLTYSFINTPPQTTFGINQATGEVTLLSNTLNYQTTKSYTLKVVAVDNGSPVLSDTATLVIFVLYQNFPPTDITINNTTVKENSAIGIQVGAFGTSDKNIEDAFTYSLVNGLNADDNGSFIINENFLLTSAVFDYEKKSSYKIRVQTKDKANNTFEKTFTISIDNVNDKPNINDKTLAVDEKAPNGTVLGTITGTDADISQSLSYSFLNTSPPQNVFGINATTGQVSLVSNALNFQTTQSYTLKVVALDNGTPALSDTATLTVVVLFQNYAPTDITISNTKIKENIEVGTKIADFSTFDKNTGDVFTYSFIDGVNADDNSSFTITGSSLFTNSTIDYESQISYHIRVQTKDLSGNLFQKAFVINVTNLNEEPKLQDQTMTAEEDVTAGTVIGTVAATDEDNFQILSYSIVNDGVPQNLFKIDKLTGDITVLVSNLNYTVTPSYTLKIAVWDSGTPSLSDTASVQILVVDKNYPPTDLVISDDNVNENKPANHVVARFSSVDKDLGEIFTYSFVSGANSSDNSLFLIKGDSLLTKTSLNYEKQTSYNITVQTKDSGGNAFEKTFTINVNDLNEKPALADQTVSIEENSASGMNVCTFTAIDEDKNQHLTYSFIGKVTPNIVRLDAVTGEIVLVTNTLDYEKETSYTFQVSVIDDGNPVLSDTATLVIQVLDVIEGTLASVDYVSANGDGKNDYWFIENVDLYSEYKLMIFDANGIMVYRIDSGYDNSWNGIYHGSQLPIGAYYYVLSSNSDESKSFKGTITLVR